MVNGLYSAELLDRFDAELQYKRTYLAKNNVFFYYDNATAHTSTITTAKFVEFGDELLTHPTIFFHEFPENVSAG